MNEDEKLDFIREQTLEYVMYRIVTCETIEEIKKILLSDLRKLHEKNMNSVCFAINGFSLDIH